MPKVKAKASSGTNTKTSPPKVYPPPPPPPPPPMDNPYYQKFFRDYWTKYGAGFQASTGGSGNSGDTNTNTKVPAIPPMSSSQK